MKHSDPSLHKLVRSAALTEEEWNELLFQRKILKQEQKQQDSITSTISNTNNLVEISNSGEIMSLDDDIE